MRFSRPFPSLLFKADVGRPRLSLCFFHNPGFKAVVRTIENLPPRLATVAAANREVRNATAAAGEGSDLYGTEPRPYGYVKKHDVYNVPPHPLLYIGRFPDFSSLGIFIHEYSMNIP